MILDEQGAVIDANPEYVRLSGHRTRTEIIGRHPTEWIVKEQVQSNIKAIDEFLATGDQLRDHEVEYQHANGLIVPIELNVAIIKNDQGNQMLALCRDITRREKNEKALR